MLPDGVSGAELPYALPRIAIIGFTVLISVLLLNLLVAQLNMAYKLVHSDMQGYARLTRGGIIVSTVEQVSRKRWDAFLQTLAPARVLGGKGAWCSEVVVLLGALISLFGFDWVLEMGSKMYQTVKRPVADYKAPRRLAEITP